jgi:hypothetical protein
MLELMLTLVIGLIIIGLLWWIVTQLPLPEPFGRIAQVVIVVLAVLWLIYVLMGAMPGGTVRLPR